METCKTILLVLGEGVELLAKGSLPWLAHPACERYGTISRTAAGKPWLGFSGFVKERIKLLRRACGNIFQTSYEEDRVSITPRSHNSPPSALITLYQIHRICQPPIIISKRSTSFLCIQRGGFGIFDNRHAPKDQGLLLVGVL